MINYPTDSTSFATTIGSLPEAMLKIFAIAIKKGYWPDGRVLTQTQVDICCEVLQLRNFPITKYCYSKSRLH